MTIEMINHDKARQIIETREPKGLFVEACEDGFVAIDNTDGNAWTEEFRTKGDAFAWLMGNEYWSASRWVSVSEALPEPFKRVLVARPGEDDIIVEQGWKDVGPWWKIYGCRTKQVTHWMPMPAPPNVPA